MAKGVYFGVGEKARKVKKLYFGVGDKSRKVKKMYFGVDGKARICYSSGLSSRKTPGQFSTQGIFTNSKVGDYMLRSHEGVLVETLNKSFVKGNATPFQIPAYSSGGSWNPSYAIFSGGYLTSNNTTTANMHTYTTSLVHGRATDLLRSAPTGGNVGNYAILSGGLNHVGYGYAWCTLYNQSLAQTTLISSTYFGNVNSASANVGDKILIAGGRTYSASGDGSYDYSSKVAYVNSSGGWDAVTELSAATTDIGGAGNGNYALFAGTGYGSGMLVTAYNPSLTRIIPAIPTRRRATGIVARVGEYIVIFGGENHTTFLSEITTYNQNLVMGVSDETLINPTFYPNAFEFNNGAIVTYKSGSVYSTYFYDN